MKRRGRRSPPLPPPVLDPELAAEAPEESPPPEPRALPRERHADGKEIDWGRESTLNKGNANLVMLWFIVPLVLLFLYQLVFDGGSR
ncbi:MAG: hypothetical protein R3B82_25080 [Sandaracinaceae bacterium]